jgi:hypothetical protein
MTRCHWLHPHEDYAGRMDGMPKAVTNALGNLATSPPVSAPEADGVAGAYWPEARIAIIATSWGTLLSQPKCGAAGAGHLGAACSYGGPPTSQPVTTVAILGGITITFARRRHQSLVAT